MSHNSQYLAALIVERCVKDRELERERRIDDKLLGLSLRGCAGLLWSSN
jgi:hypothetical protein